MTMQPPNPKRHEHAMDEPCNERCWPDLKPTMNVEPDARPSVVIHPWDNQPMPEQGPPPPVKYSSFGGSYTQQFHTEQEYADYKAGQHEVEMQAYHVCRVKYGIWASNQNKYVSSLAELNWVDGRTMETQYAAWCCKKGIEYEQ